MHLEFLVEEESAETALDNLVPKIVGPNISLIIFVFFQGKFNCLKNCRNLLKGYHQWLPNDS